MKMDLVKIYCVLYLFVLSYFFHKTQPWVVNYLVTITTITDIENISRFELLDHQMC